MKTLNLPHRRRDEVAAALRRELRDLRRETPRAINAQFWHELKLKQLARELGISDTEIGL